MEGSVNSSRILARGRAEFMQVRKQFRRKRRGEMNHFPGARLGEGNFCGVQEVAVEPGQGKVLDFQFGGGAIEGVTDDRVAALAHAAACGRVVVEEYLDGPEVSVLCVTDGTTVVPLVPAQDFKKDKKAVLQYKGKRGTFALSLVAFWALGGLVVAIVFAPRLLRRPRGN